MTTNKTFNSTRTLIEIETDVARINAKIDDLHEVSNKAEKALELANENRRDIARLIKNQNWVIATLVTGIGGPIIVAIIRQVLSSH